MPAKTIARADNKPARKRPAEPRAEQRRRRDTPAPATQTDAARRFRPVRAPARKKPGSKGVVAPRAMRRTRQT